MEHGRKITLSANRGPKQPWETQVLGQQQPREAREGDGKISALGRNSTRHQHRLGTVWPSGRPPEKELADTGTPSCAWVSGVLWPQTPRAAQWATSGAARPAGRGEGVIQHCSGCTWNGAGRAGFRNITSPRAELGLRGKLVHFDYWGEWKKRRQKQKKPRNDNFLPVPMSL